MGWSCYGAVWGTWDGADTCVMEGGAHGVELRSVRKEGWS